MLKTVTRWLMLGTVVALIGLAMGPPGAEPPDRAVAGLVKLSGIAANWITRDPKVAGIVIVVAVVLFYGAKLIGLASSNPQRDPVRMFSPAQRKECFDRAGGRCEMDNLFFFRCRRPAEHADHWLPWSKGGSTSMENAVAACRTCNLAKSDGVPTFWETARLSHRRRRYFPSASRLTPGDATPKAA